MTEDLDKTMPPQSGSSESNPLLTLVKLFLKSEDFQRAISLMAEEEVNDSEDLKIILNLPKNKTFQLVMRFSDSGLKTSLNDILNDILQYIAETKRIAEEKIAKRKAAAQKNGLKLSDDAKTVTGVKDECITSIVIPDGVTSIGNGAFKDCEFLKSITIPEGVTSIEASAFSGCSGLTEIVIPENVRNIGAFAFAGCSGPCGHCR